MLVHMMDIHWSFDEGLNRWLLSITNNLGYEIHDFNMQTAGMLLSYPPPWASGVTRGMRYMLPGRPPRDTSVSYANWYGPTDDNNEFPIEQILPPPPPPE